MVLAARVQGRGILQARIATTNVTCDSQYSWMSNSQGQSPCLLASTLSAPCSSGNWIVPTLNSTLRYLPPTTSTANYCICSWAVYNLLGACTICQDNGNINNWSYFLNGCGSYITSTAFPTDKITAPDNTLIPYWAGTDPATWPNEFFDVNRAQAINNQSHSEINLTKGGNKKSSSSTGGIAGGVIAAAVVLIISAIAVFCYVQRRQRAQSRKKALLDPLPGTEHGQPTTLHGRSLSDMSQMTAVGPATYFNNNANPYITNGHVSPTLQTSFSPSNHSLPYDVSLIGSMALGAPSPPPRPPAARPSTLPGVSEAVADGPENIIVPFTLPASSIPSDRKRPDGGVYPIYEEPNAGPSSSSRRRLNPPTYSESVNPDSGESSILGTHSPTQSIDRKGRAHGHHNSSDSMNSASVNLYGNTSNSNGSDTASLRTHLPPGSVVGLDDAVSQLGFGAPSVVGAGSAAMTSNRGARRPTLPASEGSVLNADEIA